MVIHNLATSEVFDLHIVPTLLAPGCTDDLVLSLYVFVEAILVREVVKVGVYLF